MSFPSHSTHQTVYPSIYAFCSHTLILHISSPIASLPSHILCVPCTPSKTSPTLHTPPHPLPSHSSHSLPSLTQLSPLPLPRTTHTPPHPLLHIPHTPSLPSHNSRPFPSSITQLTSLSLLDHTTHVPFPPRSHNSRPFPSSITQLTSFSLLDHTTHVPFPPRSHNSRPFPSSITQLTSFSLLDHTTHVPFPPRSHNSRPFPSSHNSRLFPSSHILSLPLVPSYKQLYNSLQRHALTYVRTSQETRREGTPPLKATLVITLTGAGGTAMWRGRREGTQYYIACTWILIGPLDVLYIPMC